MRILGENTGEERRRQGNARWGCSVRYILAFLVLSPASAGTAVAQLDSHRADLISTAPSAQVTPLLDLQHRCERFSPKRIANGAVLTAVHFEAATPDRPERCVLKARIVSSPSSTINFRVDLPAPSTWNTKLLVLGGGGFDGMIPTEMDLWRSLVRFMGIGTQEAFAYVVGSTDSGHQARVPFFDLTWAAGNPTALRNHASEANHLVLGAMVNLARAFYGKAPVRRYIVGGSNGGRQGLMAAQRHPEDYDGVLAFVPAISQNATAANLTPLLKHIFSVPENWLDGKRITRYVAAELAACDELDGLKDGVIDNYRGCRYDPAELACRGADTDDCLTLGQIQSLRLFFDDKRVPVPFADGLIGYPASGRGGSRGEWSFVFGATFAGREAVNFILVDNMVKNTITGDPNASPMTHDPEHWASQYLAMSELLDTTNPDLSAFARRGGKIIVLHGAADYCVSYERTGQYVRSVETRLGKDVTRQFLRYYVAPAVGHGLSGPGADSFTAFRALEDWVEQGRRPEGLIASKRDPKTGTVEFTRPLCEYGAYPRFSGSGDPGDAKNFACTAY